MRRCCTARAMGFSLQIDLDNGPHSKCPVVRRETKQGEADPGEDTCHVGTEISSIDRLLHE